MVNCSINTACICKGGKLPVLCCYFYSPQHHRRAVYSTGGKASYPPEERLVLLFLIFPQTPPYVQLEERLRIHRRKGLPTNTAVCSTLLALFRALKNFPLKRKIITSIFCIIFPFDFITEMSISFY